MRAGNGEKETGGENPLERSTTRGAPDGGRGGTTHPYRDTRLTPHRRRQACGLPRRATRTERRNTPETRRKHVRNGLYGRHASEGARCVCHDPTDSDDPTAVLMRRIIDAFAEYERLLIRARTKAALQVKARRGERVSGRIPYGFRLSDDGTTLARDEAEQVVIDDILAKRRQGWKLERIAADLDARGVATKCGTDHWRNQTVSQIIRRHGENGGARQ